MTTLIFLAILLGPLQLTQADPNCYKPGVGWVACAAPQTKCCTLTDSNVCSGPYNCAIETITPKEKKKAAVGSALAQKVLPPYTCKTPPGPCADIVNGVWVARREACQMYWTLHFKSGGTTTTTSQVTADNTPDCPPEKEWKYSTPKKTGGIVDSGMCFTAAGTAMPCTVVEAQRMVDGNGGIIDRGLLVGAPQTTDAVHQWKEDCNTCTEWSDGHTSCTLAMCLTQEQIDKAFPPESGICTGACVMHVWPSPKEPEPEDVPAVMVTDGSSYVRECKLGEGGMTAGGESKYCLEPRATCTDKSRVLLTAEDGSHWCHKINSGILGVIIDSGDHDGVVDSGVEPPK